MLKFLWQLIILCMSPIPVQRRKSMIESLKGLIAQSEEIYAEAPAEH